MSTLRIPGLVLLGLLLVPLLVTGEIVVNGNHCPGKDHEIQCDLPVGQRLKNIGSRADGAGMCVMSSIEMAARWANLEAIRGLRDWCAQQPGGGYPSKVEQQIKQYCQAKNLPMPSYRQIEKTTVEDVRRVLATGRMACVTYAGRDGVRYPGRIAHMVCVAHADQDHVALLDNNFIGDNEILWMTPAEFDQRFRDMQGGWLFWWNAPPPPPVPHN